MAIQITKEKIKGLYDIYDDLDRLEADASDAIKKAQLNGSKEVLVNRKDKGKQKVTEKMLWDEVYHLGPESEAGDFLKKKYPEAFKKSDMHNVRANELRDYALAQIGIDSQAIKLRDIIQLVDAIVDLKVKEIRKSIGEPSTASGTAPVIEPSLQG
jgi:hypothetical protein